MKLDIDGVKGCTDGGCIFGHPRGMHTNGGCNCLRDVRPTSERLRLMRNVHLLVKEVERLRAENQRVHHRCAALAYLHYGHYLVQRTPESVQSDIEACESALTALRAELRDLPQSAEQQF